MNVLVCASSASSGSHGLSNTLRSVLSPFYAVQSVLPLSLATQPWSASCALLVLLPPDDTPTPAHDPIQQYISDGGRILGIGLGAALLPRRQIRGRFELWDAASGTAIVPHYPQAITLPPPSSILLQTGALLSSLRQAGVLFSLTPDVQIIHGRWEEPLGAIAGIQVPIGCGRAAFWDISPPCFDEVENTENVTALLRYALTSLGLSLPPAPETTAVNDASSTANPLQSPLLSVPLPPRGYAAALPQFLLHPRGKRYISETILQRLGVGVVVESSGTEQEPEPGPESVVVIKDKVDTFHFHKVATVEHGARLVAEAKASASADADMEAQRPRIIVVLPPDVLPTGGELTPRFDVDKYFAVLAEVRGDRMNAGGAEGGWGVGEALLYGEVVTSTQTMLERYARVFTLYCRYIHLPFPIPVIPPVFLIFRNKNINVYP
jgi:biotin---protein ligase